MVCFFPIPFPADGPIPRSSRVLRRRRLWRRPDPSTGTTVADTLTSVGLATATILNPKKTRGPATSLVILGLLYCSKTKTCRLGEDKQSKYLARIVAMVGSTSTSSKELEKLTGNLGFAAWVEPFCRPLLSCLYSAVVRDDPAARVRTTHLMRSALSV